MKIIPYFCGMEKIIQLLKDLFSEMNKFSQGILILIIGSLLVSPIWLSDIVLFSKTVYKTQPLYVVVLFTYCLTIAITISSTFLSFMILMLKIKRMEGKETEQKDPMSIGVIVSIVSLLLATGTGVLFIRPATFIHFAAWVFVSHIICIVIVFFIGKNKSKKQ